MGRVQSLANVEEIAQVTDLAVDPVSGEDVRELLKRPLNVEAAVRIALLNNRELRATLREMGIARGRLIQAGLLPNPTVELELLPERNTQVELRLEYDITNALLAPVKARAIAPELDAARYRVAAAVVQLGYDVRVAFYMLQAAEQRLMMAQQVFDGAAAGRDAAKAMFEAGNINELDVASQEVAYQKTRIVVAQMELEVALAREQVQRLFGVHGAQTNWTIEHQLAPAPRTAEISQTLERDALGVNLGMLETKQRLESLARRTGATSLEGWVPDVSIDVHGLKGNPDAAADQQWQVGGGVSVGVPLFDRRQGLVVELRAEFDALMERYYGMAVDLRSGTREIRARVSSSHARAIHYQEVILPAQRKVLEQTLLQYNAMQLGVFHLLEARAQLLELELSYIETLREYWCAMAELDALLAGQLVSLRSDTRGATTQTPSQTSGGH